MTGRRFDAKHGMPYIFGCIVIVLRDENDRGPAGSKDKGRTYAARYLGKGLHGHIVEKLDTGAICYPSHCYPYNEHELVRDSLPPGAALHSTESQTIAHDMNTMQHTSKAPAVSNAPPIKQLAMDSYPIGTRLSIRYRTDDGKDTWFDATVSRVVPSGKRFKYGVDWDDDRWANDCKWQGTLIDLQAAGAPLHKLLKQPVASQPQMQEPPPIGHGTDGANIPDGRSMSISLGFGGLEDLTDGIKERTMLRYKRASVAVLDAKNDPIGQDVTSRAVRSKYWQELANGKHRVVFHATPCGSYTHCSGKRLRGRSKGEIWGLEGLSAADAAYLKRHNVFTRFTIEVLEYCDAHAIPCGVECSPDRGVRGSDAHWQQYELWASFWNHPRVMALEKRGFKRYLVARCRNEDPVTAQKYYEFMFSKHIVPTADRVFSDELCIHTWHPDEIRGKTDDGYWKSQQYEEYPPWLCDKLAIILTECMVPPGQTPAPKPPFSSTPRVPTPPAFIMPTVPAAVPMLTSPQEAVMDALLASDEPWSQELDAAMVGDGHYGWVQEQRNKLCEVQACSAEGNGPCSAPTAEGPISAGELASLVCELKIAEPDATDRMVHAKLKEAGVMASMRSVKRVRVGWMQEQERSRQRAQRYEAARREAQAAQRANDQRLTGIYTGQVLSSARTGELHASKATQQLVDVHTKVGTRIMKVPSSSKQVRMSPEAHLWVEADRVAMRSILVGGNKLVRRDCVPQGEPIGPCVTARRLKVDQATGELDKFKSRHALDGKRLALIRERLGLPPPTTGTCNIIDDLALKTLFADVAGRCRSFAKADVSDAYVKGRRNRKAGYMRMPDTCQEYDEDGCEMVVMLVTPLWGEQEAGFEWDFELHSRLLAIGWRQCAGVPAMYFILFTPLLWGPRGPNI